MPFKAIFLVSPLQVQLKNSWTFLEARNKSGSDYIPRMECKLFSKVQCSLALTSFSSLCRTTEKCMGFSSCMTGGDNWVWLGGGSTPHLPIAPPHQAAMSGPIINEMNPCVYLLRTDLTAYDDESCNKKYQHICTISFEGAGLGSSIGNFSKSVSYRN